MKLLNIFLFSLLISCPLFKAQTQYQSATVGFYNVENLFDYYNSADVVNSNYPKTDSRYKVSMPLEEAKAEVAHLRQVDSTGAKVYVDYQIISDEFTPEGTKNYTEERYEHKLVNISSVISKIGVDIAKNAPVVMGLVEVENRQVVEDLISEASLKPYHYDLVHFNSEDARGIDVALIYQKGRFKVLDTEAYHVELPPEPDGDIYTTRDILRVSGLLDGEHFSFFVNHWPSRRGGEAASAPKRAAAAEVLKNAISEVKAKSPDEKIIAMGDFNDDPTSPSLSKILDIKGDKSNLGKNDLYSPMVQMYKDGNGTLAYRDSWNLFDIMIFSDNLVGKANNTDYKVFKTSIFSARFLVAKEGQFKGYPRRTYGGDNFDSGGYSDHFPVYTVLLREVN